MSPHFIRYPTIHHRLSECNCDDIENNQTLKKLCNKQNIIVGLLYYPWETYDNFPATLDAVAYLKEGILGKLSDDYLNEYSKPAALVSIRGSLAEENVTESDVRNGYLAVCPFYAWSMIVFNAYDQFSHVVNGYAFQVNNAACANSVYNQKSFDEILNVPFEFTEKYKSCTAGVFSTLIFAIGVSAGNAQFITQIVLFVFTMLLGEFHLFQKRHSHFYFL